MANPYMTKSNPSLGEKWQAIQQNVQAYYERSAFAKGEVVQNKSPDILLTTEHATFLDEDSLTDKQLDRSLDWYRNLSESCATILWYLSPKAPVSLDARLLARGASPNWRPHWMCCDLNAGLENEPEVSKDVNIEIYTGNDSLQIQPMPTQSSSLENEGDSFHHHVATSCPYEVYHLTAIRNEVCLGSCILNLTTIGAVFDMEVIPSARRQGIGTALALATRNIAVQLGYRYLFLNATEMGESVYRKVGFESLGYGHTWHLPATFRSTVAPSQVMVKFLEAVMQGHVVSLEELKGEVAVDEIQQPTINGLTAFELAVHTKQAASARWLIQWAIVPDIISLWDLGWKDDVRALIRSRPESVNVRSGTYRGTPLHTAVERGDMELAKTLLEVPNDLDIRDEVFNCTALQWTKHFDRAEIRVLIEKHQETKVNP